MKKKRNFTNEFKTSAVQYVKEHPELSQRKVAENLGISLSTLTSWLREVKKNTTSQVSMVGTGNYQSEEAKENTRLRRELRDTKDALDILKKAISILGD